MDGVTLKFIVRVLLINNTNSTELCPNYMSSRAIKKRNRNYKWSVTKHGDAIRIILKPKTGDVAMSV